MQAHLVRLLLPASQHSKGCVGDAGATSSDLHDKEAVGSLLSFPTSPFHSGSTTCLHMLQSWHHHWSGPPTFSCTKREKPVLRGLGEKTGYNGFGGRGGALGFNTLLMSTVSAGQLAGSSHMQGLAAKQAYLHAASSRSLDVLSNTGRNGPEQPLRGDTSPRSAAEQSTQHACTT